MKDIVINDVVLDGMKFEVGNAWFRVNPGNREIIFSINCEPTKDEMSVFSYENEKLEFSIGGGRIISRIEEETIELKFQEGADCDSDPRIFIYTHHWPTSFTGKISKVLNGWIFEGIGVVDYGTGQDCDFKAHCQIDNKTQLTLEEFSVFLDSRP